MSPTVLKESEWLARYLLCKDDFRADNTVRPEPFYPYKYTELSVTRHEGLSAEDIWRIGREVASECMKILYGRADLKVEVFVSQKLRVVSTPQRANPAHADAIDWPPDKPSQKLLALQIARKVNEMKTAYKVHASN